MCAKITAKAPGKVILFGEHAVCHGKTAIATAIGLHTQVEICEQPESGQVKVNLKNFNFTINFKIQELASIDVDELTSDHDKLFRLQTPSSGILSKNAKESIVSIMYLYLSMAAELGKRLHEIDIIVESNIPLGAGLGSSASFSVAVSASLLKLFNESTSQTHPDLINKWAFKSETIFHGKPSGIDNSVATYGGSFSFLSGSKEILSGIAFEKLILVQSKVARNTKLLVAEAIRRINKFPAIINKVIDAIGEISEEAMFVLRKNDSENLNELAVINQHLLCSLGVGHRSIDEILLIAKERGYRGKLTGAGGGGCVIIFPRVPSESGSIDDNDLIDELNQGGFQADIVPVHCSGVSFH